MKFSMIYQNSADNKRIVDEWQAGKYPELPIIKRRFEVRNENGDFEVLHLKGSLWMYIRFKRHLNCMDCAVSTCWVE